MEALSVIIAQRDRSSGAVQQAEVALQVHCASRVDDRTLEVIESDLQAQQECLEELLRETGALRQRQAEDDRLRQQDAALLAELAAAEDTWRPAATLAGLIGQSDGRLFREYAQTLTLDQLLALANRRLDALAPRYQLERLSLAPGLLDLAIIDREQADERRPVATLSGGELFLASLALALALADLKGGRGRIRVGTLCIDEGFGSLDQATLDIAMVALGRLQQEQGTQILVISHVGALAELIPHRIEVQPQGGGRSRIRVSYPVGI